MTKIGSLMDMSSWQETIAHHCHQEVEIRSSFHEPYSVGSAQQFSRGVLFAVFQSHETISTTSSVCPFGVYFGMASFSCRVGGRLQELQSYIENRSTKYGFGFGRVKPSSIDINGGARKTKHLEKTLQGCMRC